MADIAGWLFFALWVFAVISCTSLGWRIPVVRDVLFQMEIRREETQKKIKEMMENGRH